MPKNSLAQNITTNLIVHRLLDTEHQNLVHWLHDDLGQNLVAIKSFASAIIEKNKGTTDDTAELAEIIKQAADAAYRSTYDLMQEIRALNTAGQTIAAALANCLEEARLKEKQIEHRLHVDTDFDDLSNFTKAVVLRSVRTCINYSKRGKTQPTLSIALHHAKIENAAYPLELHYSHQGKFDICPEKAPSLVALRKRIEAIGGIMEIKTNDRDCLVLDIHLNPLFLI